MERVNVEAFQRELAFPSNRALLSHLEQSGGRVVHQPSGHVVIYGPQGRRILATDPDGHPLHECEWVADTGGTARMLRARLRLDWSKWIGIKPRGLVHRTTLDLSKRPGWQRLTADDLRGMAARVLGVPFEEVKFFYTDEDLVIDARGEATIRHAKDAFYVLGRDTFDAGAEHVRFMACMGAMHWADIDFLPVVELFQSLLPGTGSAAFELIRGLYDDQNQGRPSRSLRYRGIPPYPSEAAYKLFSAFFAPQSPAGRDPFPVFMDARRSHEVAWGPAAEPPLRYFDEEQRLCVTVQGGVVRKVTVEDDPAGVSFQSMGGGGVAPCGRSVAVVGGRLILNDWDQQRSLPVRPEWKVVTDSVSLPQTATGPAWRVVFGAAPPQVDSREAYAAVPMYPEDDTPIGETATQPFVADYLQDQRESAPELAAQLDRSDQLLIDGFDAAVTTCMNLDRPREYRVLYAHPVLAQRQAQILWNLLVRTNRLGWLSRIRFREGEPERRTVYGEQYDMAYVWVPFAVWSDGPKMDMLTQQIASALRPEGLAFLVGPRELEATLRSQALRLEGVDAVETLPTVRMHQSVLPRTRVKAGLTLFRVRRG